MPFLFDESKLNYSGNKNAVRSLLTVCSAYREIYSNARAQLTLAKDSVQSWYATWNGAFLNTDVSVNGADAEHIQFLRQLSIILGNFFEAMNSIVTSASVPVSMEHILQEIDNEVTIDTSLSSVSIATFTGNFVRTLKLKYMVGKLHNIGCAVAPANAYDFTSEISSTNRYINGHYVYKIGEFDPERIHIDLLNKTIQDIFNYALTVNSLGTETFGSTISSYGSVSNSISRLLDQLNFSAGLLEDSINLFNAAL